MANYEVWASTYIHGTEVITEDDVLKDIESIKLCYVRAATPEEQEDWARIYEMVESKAIEMGLVV